LVHLASPKNGLEGASLDRLDLKKDSKPLDGSSDTFYEKLEEMIASNNDR